MASSRIRTRASAWKTVFCIALIIGFLLPSEIGFYNADNDTKFTTAERTSSAPAGKVMPVNNVDLDARYDRKEHREHLKEKYDSKYSNVEKIKDHPTTNIKSDEAFQPHDELPMRHARAPIISALGTDIEFSTTTPVGGEQVNVNITINNSGTDPATNLTVRFYMDDTYSDNRFGSAIVPSIASNATVTVNATWVATGGEHAIIVAIDWEENVDYPIEVENYITVPYSNILLVCDDGYADSGNVSRYYQMFWDLGLEFDTWECDALYSPTYADLAQYDYVVWYTGRSASSMTTTDTDALSAFLEDGKGLIMTGYEVAYDLHDEGAFLRDYLYADYIADDATTDGNITGISGDPISDGLNVSIVEYGTFYYSPDVIAPTGACAEECFEYLNDMGVPEGEYAGLRIDNGVWKAVYLAFALDAVNSQVDRATILNRSLNYIVPQNVTNDVAVISISEPSSSVGANSTVNVKAKIKNVGHANQTNVTVKMNITCIEDAGYGLDNQITIAYINSSETYTTNFTWAVPSTELNNYIIRITCVAAADERPINDEKNKTVLVDSVFDVGILSLRSVQTNAWGVMLANEEATINANLRNYGNVNYAALPVMLVVLNQYGVEIFNQTLNVVLNDSELKTISWHWTPSEPMGTSEAAAYGDWYTNGSMIAYVDLPNDEYPSDNMRATSVEVAAYIMDCESGMDGWTHSAEQGSDLWGITAINYTDDPDDTYHSAPNAFYCGIPGTGYEDGMDDSLYSPWFDLTNYSSASMNALFTGIIEANMSIEKYDNLTIEASADGTSWDVLYDYWQLDAVYYEGDHTDYWYEFYDAAYCDLNLTPYVGGKVQIRFRFFSDADINFKGIYIDDVAIFGDIRPKVDAGISSLNTGIGLINEARQITATISNNGREVIASASVHCRIVNATSGLDVSSLSIQTITNLAQGASATLTWTYTPTEYGTYYAVVNVSCINDEIPSNDARMKAFYILPIFENDDVEDGPRYWSVQDNSPNTDATWQIVNISSHSPVHSWYCGEPYYVYYDDNMDECLVTQPIKVDNVSKFTFWHNYSIEDEWDGGRLEVSTDYGNTWIVMTPEGGYPMDNVYVFDDTSAYSGVSDGWEKAEFDLSSFIGHTIFVRFHFASDFIYSYEGWFIDDICVEYPPANDLGVSSLTAPAIVLTNHAFNITAQIKNYGAMPQNNYSLSVIVKNAAGDVVYGNTLNLSGTIAYNEVANYIFTVPLLDSVGEYSVNATVTLAGDSELSNNIRSTTISAGAPFTSENFEGLGYQNWALSSVNDQTYWQINSSVAHSPSNSLWCGNNETGKYANSAEAWAATPPFFVSPGLGFKFYMCADFESTYDGGILEITTDGVTWAQLDPENAQSQYDSRISPYFSNPLAGKYAFCQDVDWTEKMFDLTDYQGEYAQIRFRFASDSIITAPGWNIDDVALTQPSARDLAITEASPEGNFFEVGIPTTISYKIENVGLEPQAGYRVYMTTTSRGITKEENITIPTVLYHGGTLDQAFNWTPEYSGDTNISLRVEIDNDLDVSNNYANFTCKVYVPGKIILVDDDNGLGNSGTLPDVEGDMIASLEDGAYTYAYYMVDSWQDGPSLDILSRYEIVIWLLGRSSDHTLTSADINALTSYLQSGGNLWLIGQDALSDIGASSFARDYLHVASYTTNVASSTTINGVASSDISYDLNLTLMNDSAKPFLDLPDALVPAGDALGVYQSTVAGNYSAISYSGSYNVVFFAFEFAFISSQAVKSNLTERIISNFAKFDAYCPYTYQEVKPGVTASYEVTIRNLGRETATLNISNTAIANWDVRRSTNGTITLAPKASTVVFLNVTPPSNARAYSVGSIYLNGQSANGRFSLLTSTVVLPVYGISVSSSSAQTAMPGYGLDYTIYVTSFANGVADTVSIGFVGLDAWSPSLNLSQVALPASSGISVATAALHLTVPGGLTAGEYTLTVNARSHGDITQTSSCVVRAIVGMTYGITMSMQVSSVTLDPYVSSSLRLNLGVTNTGNSQDTVTVSVVMPNGWSADVLPETIPAGQTRTMLLDISVPDGIYAGAYNLTIIANSNNGASNSSATLTVNVVRPDLVVSSQDISVTPTSPKQDEQLTVVVTVRNEGRGIAKNVTVQLFDGNTALGSKTINEIKPSESGDVAITCKLSKPGAREITVRVDSANNVIELDETNNFASRGVSVKGTSKPVEAINPLFIVAAVASVLALIVVIVVFRQRLFGKKDEPAARQEYAVEDTDEIESPPPAEEEKKEEANEDATNEKKDETPEDKKEKNDDNEE